MEQLKRETRSGEIKILKDVFTGDRRPITRRFPCPGVGGVEEHRIVWFFRRITGCFRRSCGLLYVLQAAEKPSSKGGNPMGSPRVFCTDRCRWAYNRWKSRKKRGRKLRMNKLEFRTFKIADLKLAKYNPRKKLKPDDKEYEKLK